MAQDIAEWAARLRRYLPDEKRKDDPAELLLDSFRETPAERSLACLTPVARIVLALTLAVAAAWLSYAAARSYGLLPREALEEVGDARWGRDYREHEATDMTVVDDRNIVVTTLGGGAQRLRADGGLVGMWQTFDAESTAGLLPDPNLIEVHNDGHRLYFVGQGGSLSSCDLNFGDWKLHFGGTGFGGGAGGAFDLAQQLSALAVSADHSFFVAGTRENGASAYDIATRQWHPLVWRESVNALLVLSGSIWVGTANGLRVFSYERRGGFLNVSPDTTRELPAEFRNRAVSAVQLVGAGEESSVECVVGRGAHLSTPARGGAWRTLVDEGDSALSSLDGDAVVPGLLMTRRGALLALPGRGIAVYEGEGRRLRLTDSESKWPWLLDSPNPDDPEPSLYMLGRAAPGGVSGLYHSTNKGWQLRSEAQDDVAGLTFVGQQPLLKLGSGFVKLLPESGTPFAFFAPAPYKDAAGPADVGGGRLLIAAAQGQVQSYDPAARGWRALPPTGNAPVRQLRASDEAVGVVKKNGEAGYFTGDRYVHVFGVSDLPPEAGKILSAAEFKSEFWFVRQGHAYAYDPSARSIRAAGVGLGDAFAPQQIRTTGRFAYLFGTEKGSQNIYRSEGAGWNPFNPTLSGSGRVEQTVVTQDAAVSRTNAGAVLVSPDGEKAATFFDGRADGARWRRLAADHFGKVWGVTTGGQVESYDTATGQWSTLDRGRNCADLVVQQMSADKDRLILACAAGITRLEITAGEVKPVDGLLANHNVIQLDLDGGRLWALTEARETGFGQSEVWSGDPGGDGLSKVWGVSAEETLPAVEQWQAADWSAFVEDEFWWLTPQGRLWRYSLGSPGWHSGDAGADGRRQLKLADEGVLWWLDDRDNLTAFDPKAAIRYRLGSDGFDLSHLRFLVELADTAQLWLATLALGLLVLTLLTPLLAVVVSSETSISRTRKTLLVLTLAAGAGATLSFFGGLVVNGWWLEPSLPFETAQFKDRIKDYWLEGGRLVLSTDEGLWAFKRNGASLRPLLFTPGATRAAAQDAEGYPRTDRTGTWQARRAGGRISLWHKEGDGWVEFGFGRRGWLRDHVTSFAVTRGGFVAATAAGLEEVKTDGGRSHLYPLDASETCALLRLGEDVWCLNRGGSSYRYGGPQGARWQAAPTPPGQMEAHGVRWMRGADGDTLDGAFDATAGRFLDDVAVHLVRDEKGRAWVQTKGRWRGIEITKDGVRLSKSDAAPRLASPERSWQVSGQWQVRLSESESGDAVSFIFTPTGSNFEDPFDARGRWPDEDAQSVFADGPAVWFGTAVGVRRADSSDLFLAGKRINALARAGGRLYANAEDGVYVSDGRGWAADSSPPPGLFPAERPLSLNLGAGISVTALESATDDGFETRLQEFDAQVGRFSVDKVQAIEGEPDGFWALTDAGLQRLVINNRSIARQESALAGEGIAALRRDGRGRLCAGGARLTDWRLSDSDGWQPIPEDDPDSPFETRRGQLSRLVSWERVCSRSGDTWRLVSAAGPLTFKGGKLSSDYVTSLAEGGPQPAEVTFAGLVWQGALLPLPGPNPRVRLDGGRLFARLRNGVYGYDEQSRQWRPEQTSALDAPLMKFDGLSWVAGSVAAFDPSVVWAADGGGTYALRLTARGQFPFDEIESVASRPDEVWLAHGGGVTAHQAADLAASRVVNTRAPSAVPDANRMRLVSDDEGHVWVTTPGREAVGVDASGFRALMPGEQARLEQLRRPHWSGTLEGRPARAAVAAANALTFERDGEPGRGAALPNEAVALARAEDSLWVLGQHGLYRLETLELPTGPVPSAAPTPTPRAAQPSPRR